MMGYLSSTTSTEILRDTIAALFVILFAYTDISKIIDLETFEWQMLNQPLPRWINRILIWFIPTVEIIIVFLLVFKRTQWYGLASSALLMIAFTIYVAAVVLHFFDRVPCSCGGVLRSMSWEGHLVFNLFFTVLSGVGVWAARPHPSPLASSGLRLRCASDRQVRPSRFGGTGSSPKEKGNGVTSIRRRK